MANLKTFSGFPIQNLTSDPVPFAQAKINNPYVGVWSSGGNLNTARNNIAGTNSGTPTATLAFGGYTGTAQTGATESYNGTSWTEVNDLSTARRGLDGAGSTNTAAVAMGGYTTTFVGNTELWNGTNWTEVNDLNTARSAGGSFGSSTSALNFGGETPSMTVNTEEWNGATWVEVANLSTARGNGIMGAGANSTAGLAAGGEAPPVSAATEEWNSTSNTVKTLTD